MRGGCVLTGLVLGALLNSLAGQVALSDPPEPNAAEAQSISAPTCDAEDVGLASFGPLPVAEIPNAHPRTSTEIAAARNYLIETASPGYTMARQGPELAIGRLRWIEPKLERRHGAFRTGFSVAASVTLLKHLEKFAAPAIAS